MQDLRALRLGVCTEKDQAECEDGMDDAGLAWACKKCPKTRSEDLHPYTHKLLRIRTLRMAGYPFGANNLTYEEWVDLGRLEQWLQTPAKLK